VSVGGIVPHCALGGAPIIVPPSLVSVEESVKWEEVNSAPNIADQWGGPIVR
ncbi:unnamed protein product, partial [Staurois parvus]